MVAAYCTYLTMSAVGMEPDDQHCNPLVRARGTRTASIVLGALVTFLTMAWTTTRAATYGLAGTPQRRKGEYIALPADGDDGHGLVTTQPSSRRELREAAVRAAVQSGSLPASALDDSFSSFDSDSSSSNDSDAGSDAEGGRRSRRKRDDEKRTTRYNYSLFHVVFLLSTAWVATLLTMNVEAGEGEDFVPVGRTYWASWVKIVSSWVCYAIYSWSLAAPAILPDRFDY
jgi:serine incorporator 1/3